VKIKGGLQISSQDLTLFKELKAEVPSIINALKVLNARKKMNANAAVESEEDMV